jgi:N-methylhydantoinase A
MLGIRLQTVSRGWDPREFAIVPYGGGGAMYACDIAKEVGIKDVIVPPLPGYASAFGALRVDVRHEFVKPLFTLEHAIDYNMVNDEMDILVDKAVDILRKEGIEDKNMVIQRQVDVKYWSQSTHFTVDIEEGKIKNLDKITEDFLASMKTQYGYTMPPGYIETELTNLRVIARGTVPKPDLFKIEGEVGTLEEAKKPSRKVWFKDVDFVDTDIYERGKLPVGAEFEGPAILEQPDTTTVIPPKAKCRVDDYSNVIIEVV